MLSRSSSFKTKLSQLLQGHVPTTHLVQIHAQILLTGLDQDNLIATRLIGQYPPQSALRVFHHLRNPNIFPFNAIIRVLSERFLSTDAFSIFKLLKVRTLSPNGFTFSFLLKTCFQPNTAQNVRETHTQILKSGFASDSSVGNALLAVYAKGVDDLDSAQKVFDEMPERGTVFCWTCLIAGYAHMRRPDEALTLFSKMVKENLRPGNDTMVNVLSACSNLEIREIERWERLFVENGGPDDDVEDFVRDSVDTVLVYLYGKWGKIDKGRMLFDTIFDKGRATSILLWNAMIGGYVQNGCPEEALSLFKLMVGGGGSYPYSYPSLNHVTMVSALSACAQVGDLELGKWVHEYLKTSRLKCVAESNTLLATALIDMYSKCGSLETARVIFDRMVSKDVVSFNAMIMGLAINGYGEDALMLFSQMKEFGVDPNGGTFLGVLSACNHSGMVDEGRQIFLHMHQCNSCVPEIEHYACYIDLLARGGHIEEAVEVVTSMPVEPNGIVLGAILQGCLIHNRVDLAQVMATRLIKVDPVDSAGYVMLSNVYASDHKWSKISQLRRSMRERRVMKQPGYSWINAD